MYHIAITTKTRFYGALQKTPEVLKLYSQGRYLSKEAKDRMRRAILSGEDTKLLESISSLTKGTPLDQHKTVSPVKKQNPCILGINRAGPDQRKSFTSTCATLEAPARLPSLRVTDAIKRSYLWGQRMNALKSREKSLGKIALSPDYDSAAAELTNIKGVVLAKQETKVLTATDSINKGTSKVNQAKTTKPMGKTVPCILQFNRSSSDPPNRFISSGTSEGQNRGFPQLRGADEIKQSYIKRQFMIMHRSRDKLPKAEPLTPDNDPMKNGKWR